MTAPIVCEKCGAKPPETPRLPGTMLEPNLDGWERRARKGGRATHRCSECRSVASPVVSGPSAGWGPTKR